MNRNRDMPVTSEVQLTEDQERQAVEIIATAYGVYSDNPSIPATLPEGPSALDPVPVPRVMRSAAEMPEKSSAGGKGRWRPQRGRGRARLKETLKAKTEGEEVDKEAEKEGEKPADVDGLPSVCHDSDSDVQYHNNVQDDSDRGIVRFCS